ncbi:MAG: monofunctional biosynthetic peptidoglycan transglycosylase [Deltaproteobacteria bacterium GWA2_38_16]|nr:MAG: monofunctional biosynthetic peptidoglycan transglycosylase [Deltaproteobacteria bacterium GWA2_38_16]OGQ03251.1 MAG: monofunctional biosynthetic peptidoglycan transglycosylase [Deltaproteobacteria bacterium RIFCSPHIGHO2_02_FULL_38_15]OGQ34077.1 MAG: monofunctional biosynthetic peptidoglycan transglycosylase [Deltaproteobacteria bacterium RIFCSPLOWO2_01_FULL_38_9]
MIFKKIFIGFFILIAFAGLVIFSPVDFWQVSKLKNHYPFLKPQKLGTSPEIILTRERPGSWIPLSQISKVALAAIIVSEDSSFYQHKGYDPEQIKKAIEINLKKGRYVRGASTITQQVAKNIFLTKKKSLLRKTKELLLAIWLEKNLKKNKILEIYVNIAEWGDGIYGIGEASQYYFNKYPFELTAEDGAFLAMLLPSPKRYSRTFLQKGITPFAQERIDDILAKLSQTYEIN